MRVVIPKNITSNMILENTFLNDYPLYNAGVEYSQDAVVHITDPADGYTKLYQSLQNNNIGNIPFEENSLFWVYISYSNSVAMFDQKVSKQCIQPSYVNFSKIKLNITSAIDSLCILNSEYRGINIKLTDTSGILRYNYIYNPQQQVKNWLEYKIFDPFKENKVIILTDIPLIQGVLEIEFLGKPEENFQIKVGELIIGNYVDFGWTQRGITAGIVDYSLKETDSFGNTIFIERNFSKRFSCQVLAYNEVFNRNMKTLYSLRAKPVVWVATDDQKTDEATIIYGYFKDFSTELAYPDYSIYNLEIEGIL